MQEWNLDGSSLFNVMWNKFVQLKLSLLAWRLFLDRIPLKDNLLQRGVVMLNSQLCT